MENVFFLWSLMCFVGSNLKFKLTEFGTLEIISTVETDKGEIQWSTQTERRRSSSEDNQDTGKTTAEAETKAKDKGTDWT